jgi:hypothetical protein
MCVAARDVVHQRYCYFQRQDLTSSMIWSADETRQHSRRPVRADRKTHTGTLLADLLVGTLAFVSANMNFSAEVIGRSGWWPGSHI